MSVLRLNHTGFTVANLRRATAFFRDVLGFAVTDPIRQRGVAVERMTGVPGAEVDIAYATHGNQTLEFICVQPRSGRPYDLRHCDTGFTHIAVETDDIVAMVQAIQAAGYQLLSEPQTVPAGPRKGGKNVYAQGPDGIVIELQQSLRHN